MTKIPPDDILEGLYKLRIRESEKLKTVLELCECSYAHRQVDERPSKRFKMNGDKKCSGYVENCTTIGLRISRCGAAEVFIDFAEELIHTEVNPMCSIH